IFNAIPRKRTQTNQNHPTQPKQSKKQSTQINNIPISACFSMLTFTKASSPNTLFAYKLAARNPHSPSSADLKTETTQEKITKEQ
ncbi:MAG: hypothetical protein O7C59_01175, partial [Rickettsia endosymbiont of Ixodes persulcatus]|nr:hypothetical protein [Rickettsia endosymbiont of Ixodes persulcatus]